MCGIKGHFASKRNETRPHKAYQVSSKEKEAESDNAAKPKVEDSIFAIDQANRSCPRVKINVLGSTIEVGVDTQASINAFRKEAYDKIFIKPKLEEDKSIVFSFDGDTPLKSVGKFKTKISANNHACEAEFIVFDGVRDDLLSFNSCTELELIKLTFQLIGDDKTEFEKKMIAKYPNVFSGKIGELKGYEAEFNIRKDAKPVIQKERKIPFHLKDKFENEVNSMLKEGIIEPVGNEPSRFISNLVPVPKPDDPSQLRVTLDSRDINRVIERTRTSMATCDDLMIKLNNAKYLTKVDVKGAYHQLKIAEKSR